MNIFISYSTEDLSLVKKIIMQLGPFAKVSCWAKDHEPGQEIWPQIFGWIDAADIVLAVISDNTVVRAMSVGQEIGYAKKQDKLILPIITHNVSGTELGCLQGINYLRIDNNNPGPALQALQDWVIKKQEEKKYKTFQSWALLAGVIGTLWLASRE